MSTVCLIPARGGSRRIPGKNIRNFAGKPMIAHSIDAARASGIFDRILCSTDSDEIARVAETCGATAPFRRPPELSDDHATTDDVILHALRWMEQNGGQPEYLCCLYATAPFVTPGDLKAGFEALKKNGATTALSVTSFPHPIHRALSVNARGRLEMIWPEHRLTRSQDLPEALHDAGQFYWVHVQRYVKEGRLFSSDSLPVRIPRSRVQDIDTQEDWDRAEQMYLGLRRSLPKD